MHSLVRSHGSTRPTYCQVKQPPPRVPERGRYDTEVPSTEQPREKLAKGHTSASLAKKILDGTNCGGAQPTEPVAPLAPELVLARRFPALT